MSEGTLSQPAPGLGAGQPAVAAADYEPLGTRRKVLFSTASFGAGMFNGFFNSALPLFLGRYDLPNVVVGLLAQERSFLGSIFEPIVGTVSDHTRTRLGRRRPFFLIGAPLTALFLLILSQEPPTFALVAILLVLPFFLVIANVPYRTMMADIAAPDERGGLGGLMTVLEMLGQVGVVLLVAAVWTTNTTIAFVAIALAIVLGFGLTFVSVKEPPLPPKPTAPMKVANPLVYLRSVLAYREAAKFVAALTLFWFGVGGVSPFLTRYGVYELGLSEQMAFMLFLVLVLATAACAIPAGLIGDRVGKKPVLVVGLGLFAIAALLGARAQSLEDMAVALVIVGVANGAATALAVPFLTELLPKHRMGELIGMGGMMWSISQPLGSTFAGFVADQTGTYRTLFVLTAVYLGLACLITALIHAPRHAVQQ